MNDDLVVCLRFGGPCFGSSVPWFVFLLRLISSDIQLYDFM
jgi:hypothetical protein